MRHLNLGWCALGTLFCVCPLIECMIYYTGVFGGEEALPRRRTCGQTLGRALAEILQIGTSEDRVAPLPPLSYSLPSLL